MYQPSLEALGRRTRWTPRKKMFRALASRAAIAAEHAVVLDGQARVCCSWFS